MNLITCISGIVVVTFLPVHALRIQWEPPVEATKTVVWEQEETGSNHVGNVLANIASNFYNANQCGRCGAQQVEVKGEDSQHVLKDVFGEVFPLKLDLTKDPSTCDAKLQCDKSARKDCLIPQLHLTKKLLNQHLTPLVKDKEKLAAMSKELGETLVVHLRGGDVLSAGNKYEKAGRSTYMPAPCAFVTEVIKSGNFEKVRLVGETGHPCINHIKETFPTAVYKESQTVYEDFLTLMSATNIALSTSSTFGLSATMLNPNEDLRIFMPTYSGKKVNGDGSFSSERLDELCHIGKQAVVYEILSLDNNPVPKDRTAWVLDNSKFENAIAHKCS